MSSFSLFSTTFTSKSGVSPQNMESQGTTTERKNFENAFSAFGDFGFTNDWKDETDSVDDSCELLDNAGAVFRQSPFSGPDLWLSSNATSYLTTHENDFSFYSKPITKSVSSSALSHTAMQNSPPEITPLNNMPRPKNKANAEHASSQNPKQNQPAPARKRAQRSTSDPVLNAPKPQKSAQPQPKPEELPKEPTPVKTRGKASGFLRVFRPKLKPSTEVVPETGIVEIPVSPQQKEEIVQPIPSTLQAAPILPLPALPEVPPAEAVPAPARAELLDNKEAIPAFTSPLPSVPIEQIPIVEENTWPAPKEEPEALQKPSPVKVLHVEPPKKPSFWYSQWKRLPPSLWGYLVLFSVIYVLASPVHVVFHSHWEFTSAEIFGWCVFFIALYMLLIWIQLKFVLSILPSKTPPAISTHSKRRMARFY